MIYQGLQQVLDQEAYIDRPVAEHLIITRRLTEW